MQYIKAPVVRAPLRPPVSRPARPSATLEQVIGDLLKESTSWLKRRELLSGLPELVASQSANLSERVYPSLVSAVAVQILDDRSALSRLGCEVLAKLHRQLRSPEILVGSLPCLVKQLANSAFVVSTAAGECLMDIMSLTPAPCLFLRLASLYDSAASVKVRTSLLKALVLPLKHVAAPAVEQQPAGVMSFMLDEDMLNQSCISVSSGVSWRVKVTRTLQRVLANDSSAELRVLAKTALKHLGVCTISAVCPKSPSSPQGEVDKALGEGDRGRLRTALTGSAKIPEKTWAKILSVALETREAEIISLMARRDDGRRFLGGFQELIQHTFPGLTLSRGV